MLKAVFLLCLFLLPNLLKATTIALMAIADGIVIASDSKTNFQNDSLSNTGQSAMETKFAIVQDRIVVANIGVFDFKREDVHYNFLTWMRGLQRSLPADISVSGFVKILTTETAKTFGVLTGWIKSGALKRPEPGQPCTMLAQYIVAGYENGIGTVYEVQYYADWNQQIVVGPVSTLLQPDPNASGNIHLHLFGQREAIADLSEPQSYAYQEALRLCPGGFGNLISHRAFTLHEAADLTRTLVQIEEKVSPSEVGGPVRVISILPARGASEEVDSQSLPQNSHQ